MIAFSFLELWYKYLSDEFKVFFSVKMISHKSANVEKSMKRKKGITDIYFLKKFSLELSVGRSYWVTWSVNIDDKHFPRGISSSVIQLLDFRKHWFEHMILCGVRKKLSVVTHKYLSFWIVIYWCVYIWLYIWLVWL